MIVTFTKNSNIFTLNKWVYVVLKLFLGLHRDSKVYICYNYFLYFYWLQVFFVQDIVSIGYNTYFKEVTYH